jgi:hypothetical protein
MPINRLLKDSLRPEDVERLNRAYTCALHKLHLLIATILLQKSSPERSLRSTLWASAILKRFATPQSNSLVPRSA